jgi:hypothetical protein
MNIQVKDNIGFPIEDTIKLVDSLLRERKPKDGSFNYGLETHGMFGFALSIKLDYPIQVYQTNKRTSNKSPIVITISRHYPLA